MAALQRAITLNTGTLELSLQAGDSDYALDDLVGFAERRNPKRAFLFVSKVLGRHIPVAPSDMRAATDALAARLPALPEPVIFIGMAETALALGAGVQQAYSRQHPNSQSFYLCTTRHPLPEQAILAEFLEEHSHATRQVLHWPQHTAERDLLQQAASLVLVDDEASTGKTFANLLQALQQAGLSFQQLAVATLTDWSDGQAAQQLGAHTLTATLLQGKWHWRSNGAPLPEMPAVDLQGHGDWQPQAVHDWGRLGVQQHALPQVAESLTVTAGERILVLGTGEFVWPPFLLAEYLEQQGVQVAFSATTRSPIALGHSIQRRYCLHDNYGQGIPNFLYNIDPQDYERILVCCEPPAALMDKQGLAELEPTYVDFYP